MNETTVSDLLRRSASVIHLDDETVSVADVAREGERLASALRDEGLGAGSRLAVWAANGLPYLRLLAAAAAGRFVLVSVNTRFGEGEALDIVRRSGATLLLTDHGLEHTLAGVRAVPIGRVDEWVKHAGSATSSPLTRPSPDDPFVVFTTSGTTSRPKLVLHQQRSIAHHSQEIPARFGYSHNSRVMIALPLCGVFGLNGLLGAVAADSEIWLPSRFDAAEVAGTIETERITSINGSDDMFHRLLITGRDLSSIDVAGYGRFNTSLDGLVHRADESGLRLTGLYGMSEVQALFALRNPDEPVAGRERAGGSLTSPDGAVRVVDPASGTVVPVGTEGELQVRGPSLFAGYLDEGGEAVDAVLTNGAHDVDRDGNRWFRTGDLARMETDGTFTYLTRMGDVLRLGGFLVNPSEIEEVVMQVEHVEAAQVVAVPRPEGVRPVAFVISKRHIDEQAVIDHCRRHLAIFKTPIRVLEIDEFPSTPSANGTKIQRNRLRDLAVDILDRKVVR